MTTPKLVCLCRTTRPLPYNVDNAWPAAPSPVVRTEAEYQEWQRVLAEWQRVKAA
ncbi:MAG: hypothetical protein U5N53_05800 [Mycobacterium sp.]|nr:hypothetical protein [Mycobacterium sp.]